MDLSIIIVNYNTKDYLQKLLRSIKPALKTISAEVFVVDNGSTDGSQLLIKTSFPWVKLMALKKNFGFSQANNWALKKAQGKFLLLLNSDTEVLADTFKKSLNFISSRSKAGLITCRVELDNGELDPASHRGFPTPWAALTYFSGLEKLCSKSRLFGQYHQGWKDLNQAHQIDSPSGCFFLLRNKAFKEIGYLDEDFFMYGEDLDYALRLKQAGWQAWFYPGTKIIHYKKRSGRANTNKQEQIKATRHFFKTMGQFYSKHYLKHYPNVFKWLVLLAIWLLEKIKILSIYL
ncbi:glycosyltransferase family 2 protein [Patescibacteria group bacterium]|nr:glycosyltransferase family 2 protein [Patescibacteria group bacterium]MBU1931645.1 glycosyltransferase family 2 protein [Patescibacteria group bacterium]